MALATEVECTNSVFTCSDSECEGVMEANAMGWLNPERGPDGKPRLEVFGFSEADYSVTCSECGSDGDAELERAVGKVIYGSGKGDWFRG
ncbi:hypothetical protein AB0I84_02050 [Streptomyces spectabilis]|uniref:hypothetical protein n=1 Tax=Streptomyces spectabilis TaxID=68270 RepID=UPI00340CFCE4